MKGKGIEILNLLSKELKKKKKSMKVPADWLDRLRAKKGFPTGDKPSLEEFLKNNANTNGLDAHLDNPTHTPSSENRSPTNSGILVQISKDASVFQTQSYRRCPRKQSHPTKICLPSSPTTTIVPNKNLKMKGKSFI
ncbi:hypothetical protein RIF29_11342 [Crotalaria pallida]|uniref:Uncharacterized protein n=1 Tax=Crotalaria pallida TaxID=3830 RepID=A0AAN9IM08_CROPI